MKTPKTWQEKQWYPEDRPNVDLSSRLQELEAHKYPKLHKLRVKARYLGWQSVKLVLGIGLILGVGRGVFSVVEFPWHWRLFSHWLLRQGDISEVPMKLHQELNNLCLNAGLNGQVNGYRSSPEIAYSLGNFQCLPLGNQNWIIRDKYGFDNSTEALAGSPLAQWLIEIRGADYTYNITATIPKTSPTSAKIAKID